jgi:hypothetical protein
MLVTVLFKLETLCRESAIYLENKRHDVLLVTKKIPEDGSMTGWTEEDEKETVRISQMKNPRFYIRRFLFFREYL